LNKKKERLFRGKGEEEGLLEISEGNKEGERKCGEYELNEGVAKYVLQRHPGIPGSCPCDGGGGKKRKTGKRGGGTTGREEGNLIRGPWSC